MSSANNQDILKILKKINKRLTAIETRLDANRDSKQVSNKEKNKVITTIKKKCNCGCGDIKTFNPKNK